MTELLPIQVEGHDGCEIDQLRALIVEAAISAFMDDDHQGIYVLQKAIAGDQDMNDEYENYTGIRLGGNDE